MTSDSALLHDGVASVGAGCSRENGTIPHFAALRDETTFSYVSRARLLGSGTTRSAVIATLFGRPMISVHRPLHSGFGAFSLHLYGRISTDALDQHSLMALFQTFSHPDRYAKAVEHAMSGRARAYLFLYSAQADTSKKEAYFRHSPAICPACVKQDLMDFYFAYYRRQHQVLASEYCAQHKSKLITSCSKCDSTLLFTQLPKLNCANCGASFASEDINESDTCRSFRVRLSQFINSMLSGELPKISQSQRIALLGARSRQIVPSSYSSALGDSLTRYIRAIYGDEFLKRMRLFPHPTDSSAWPALILSGAAMLDNPIANALLTSALWASPEDYRAELKLY